MFTVSAGGCYTNHPAPFRICRPQGIPEYLLLYIYTPASFMIGSCSFQVQPEQIVLIDRNVPYEYSTADHNYIDDWMHFDCSEEEALQFKPFLNQPIYLRNNQRIAAYFHQIFWENNNNQTSSAANVHMLMQILMNHIMEAWKFQKDGKIYNPYFARMQELRLQMKSNPAKDISVEEAAHSLSISTSYFQHLYKQFFQISFRNDQIQMRIDYAKVLLCGTVYTIEYIACLCGYHNEVHFYRQFHRITGMTPGEYRSLILS